LRRAQATDIGGQEVNVPKRLAQLLTVARAHSCHSLAEAGQALGVSASTVSRWSTGDILPAADRLEGIAQLFDVPLSELQAALLADLSAPTRGVVMATKLPRVDSQERLCLDAVWALHKEGSRATVERLAEACDMPRGSAYAACRRLVDRGLLEPDRRGKAVAYDLSRRAAEALGKVDTRGRL